MAFSIQLRRDTSVNWGTVNPILLKGEPGFETDTNKLKIGDGITAWNVLPYLVPEATPVTSIPTGSITAFAGSAAPSGWLMCNGSAVSRTTYADLFSVISTTYGVGDGATTFNLPNLNGRVPAGFDVTQSEFDFLGKTGGTKTHTLTVNEMPSHTHTQNSHSHTITIDNGGSHDHTASTNSAGDHNHTASTESAGDHAHTGSTSTAGSHDHGDIASSGSHTHTYNTGNSVGRQAGTSTGIQGIVLGVENTTGARSHAHTITAQGSHTHTLTIASAGSHTHTITVGSAGSHSHTVTVNSGGSHNHTATIANATAVNQNTGGGLAHNIMQPYIVLNYMIKT